MPFRSSNEQHQSAEGKRQELYRNLPQTLPLHKSLCYIIHIPVTVKDTMLL